MFTEYFTFINIFNIFHMVKRSLKFVTWVGRVFIFFNAKLGLEDPYNQRYHPAGDREFPLI